MKCGLLLTLFQDLEKIQKLSLSKVKTTGEDKVLKVREGLPMSEEEHTEWVNAFKDIQESIEEMDLREEQQNPNAKYLRMKQQCLF